MKRRLFNWPAIVSLLLCVATALLWARSCWREDAIRLGGWDLLSIDNAEPPLPWHCQQSQLGRCPVLPKLSRPCPCDLGRATPAVLRVYRGKGNAIGEIRLPRIRLLNTCRSPSLRPIPNPIRRFRAAVLAARRTHRRGTALVAKTVPASTLSLARLFVASACDILEYPRMPDKRHRKCAHNQTFHRTTDSNQALCGRLSRCL
jgi:hypothetical protein